jgi:hypothetical protein
VSSKARLVKAFQRRVLNPLVGTLVERGLLRGWLVLETRGSRTGLPRRTPEADARVRVCVRGRWSDATAHVTDDEPRAIRIDRS